MLPILFFLAWWGTRTAVAEGISQENAAIQRERMVSSQIEARGVKDSRVLAVLRQVERHLFIPVSIRQMAYEDMPLPIGLGQTISQPYIVALMTELLQLKGYEKVLEVGTGSGYQAAVLSGLCSQVYSIEIVPKLAARAEKTLGELGYTNITIRCADGYAGWPEEAPFDTIIVTCAPEEIPGALVSQLAEGGRLVLPVGKNFQVLKLLIKKQGRIIEKEIIPVRFVPMVKTDSVPKK